MSSKRPRPCGNYFKKKKLREEEQVKQTKNIGQFFAPVPATAPVPVPVPGPEAATQGTSQENTG